MRTAQRAARARDAHDDMSYMYDRDASHMKISVCISAICMLFRLAADMLKRAMPPFSVIDSCICVGLW